MGSGTGTTIFLARHGETDWNVDGRWQGHADRPLTERGERQAHELAERLSQVPLDAVYSSDLRRAWETAAPVAHRLGLELCRLRELREVDVGSWQGLTRAEAAEQDPAGYRRWKEGDTGWDGGETYEEMAERVVGAVRRISLDFPGGRILVVSHGGAIRAVHARANEIDIRTFRKLRPVVPNARVTCVHLEKGRLTESHEEDLDI